MASSPVKIKFTLVKRDDQILVTRYCITGRDHWVLIREDQQPLQHHELIAQKEPTLIAIQEMQRQRTITLFLSSEDAENYLSDSYSAGSISDEVSDSEVPINNVSSPSSSTINEPMASMFQELMRFQMESFRVMFSSLQESLVPLSKAKNQRMEVTKFNGRSEDAKVWLISYEKACEFNNWNSDDAKVNNLKAHLEGIALKWFNSRLVEDLPFDWSSWKSAFLDSFGQNRISQAQGALAWEYRSGALLEYYYEKQRLIQLAFPELSDQNFITLVLLGLPDELTKRINTSDISTKEELRRALTQLKPLKTKEKDDRLKVKPKLNYNGARKDSEKIFTIAQKENDCELNVFPVTINGVHVKALFDTGAHVNMISDSFVEANKLETQPCSRILKGFNGKTGTFNRELNARLGYNKAEIKTKFIVNCDSSYDAIVGIESLTELNVKWDFSSKTVCIIKPPLSLLIFTEQDARAHFPDLFSVSNKPPKILTDFKLSPEAPIVQAKPYRLSREKYNWAQSKIKELLDKGIIVSSTSKYASPCVIVPKEKSLRLCQDYREINKHTTLDPYPFPIIDDIIGMFGGCKVFTKVDLRDGFWQIGLTKETRQYSAFVLPFGHYELTRLPFGWKNSPPIFQREITKILGELLETRRVAVYIDDICVGGYTAQECAELTYKTLQKLSHYGIQINPDKCTFGAQSIVFLGRVIDGFTKTTKTESIERVRKMRKPTELHSLRCFTGLTGHFRSFIPNYAAIVRPLDRLKQKDQQFVWTQECEQSYQKLIELISSNPILSVPDWNLSFELSCDASYYGTGAILYQRDPNQTRGKQLRVIGYHSYTFTKPELNYSTTEKECLAVIRAIEYFRSYLEGKEFRVNTDHQALSHLMSLKEAKNRLGRWQTFLMTFNLTINHRAGRELTDADALSRLCPEIPEINMISQTELTEKKRISILPEQVKDVLSSYHDDPVSGGHDGVARTYHKIVARFNWPRMKEDIVNYIRTCDICQRVKAKFKPSSDFMILPKHADKMFEVIHVDYGELVKKSDINRTTKSFLVVVDEATRLCQATPMKEDASSFIEFIINHPYCSQIKTIISDCGKSFTSKATIKLARELNIKMKTTSPYSPWSNGMAERYVQKIKLYCELFPEFPGGWRKALEAAAKHNNRAYNRALGCSPFFKAFGKIDYLPADEKFGVNRICKLVEQPFTRAQQEEHRKKSQDYINRNYKKTPELKPGSMVMIINGKYGKQIRLDGPFEVKKVIEMQGAQKTVVYIKDGEEKIAHVRNCRPYHPRLGD